MVEEFLRVEGKAGAEGRDWGWQELELARRGTEAGITRFKGLWLIDYCGCKVYLEFWLVVVGHSKMRELGIAFLGCR